MVWGEVWSALYSVKIVRSLSYGHGLEGHLRD